MGDRSATFKISAAAAALLRPDAPVEQKLRGARGEVALAVSEMALVQVFLMHQGEEMVRAAARAALTQLPDEMLRQLAGSEGVHPKVLDVLEQIHRDKQWFALMLRQRRTQEAPDVQRNSAAADSPVTDAGSAHSDPSELPDDRADEDSQVSEDGAEYQNKYQHAQMIGIAEKIKYAMGGDKEWRSIMLKDPNKLVSGAVLKNPRITEQEILAIAKSTMVNEEVVRVICINKDWIKNYQIRKALVENNKTPLPTALRFMATLTEKDLAMLAKSKNVSTVISTQARKSLQNLQKRR